MYCAEFSIVSIIANMEFDILQFDDDTIIMGNTYWSNIWSIKSFLCGLEFASMLRVNFHKSKIFGCNVETSLALCPLISLEYRLELTFARASSWDPV